MFENLLKSAKRYLSAIGWLLTILETIMSLVAGGLVGALISGGDAWNWTIIAVIFYLVLLGFKI